MRWLAHRGGALDFRDHALAHPGTPFPDRRRARRRSRDDPRRGDAGARFAVRIPVRGSAARRAHRDRQVPHARPAGAGDGRDRARRLHPARRAAIRPATRPPPKARSATTPATTTRSSAFRCSRIERITLRRDPIYHSTYTGKPPDEPAVLGVALNEVFVPLLQKQFPEIADFYLPPEGCSYRLAVVSMKKQYPGHAKRVMFGVWSFLRQFMYTKFIVVTDDDVDIRDWKDVVWALTTRVDPGARHAARRVHADRLSRLRVAGGGTRQQDGHRRDEQVARRNAARVGPSDRDGRGGQGARRCAIPRIGPLADRRDSLPRPWIASFRAERETCCCAQSTDRRKADSSLRFGMRQSAVNRRRVFRRNASAPATPGTRAAP